MASIGGQAGTGAFRGGPHQFDNTGGASRPDLPGASLKISRFAAIGAIAFAAATAHAAPTSLDPNASGPITGGTFAFEGTKDASFYIVLDAGTYSFASQVDATGETLKGVWLSYTGNNGQRGKDDFYSFVANTETSYTGSFGDLVLTHPTKIFVDVDTALGKKSHGGSFVGSLTVSVVPEPATAALLLAGMGMLGFIGRRRRNNG
jgi:hypothetical protein